TLDSLNCSAGARLRAMASRLDHASRLVACRQAPTQSAGFLADLDCTIIDVSCRDLELSEIPCGRASAATASAGSTRRSGFVAGHARRERHLAAVRLHHLLGAFARMLADARLVRLVER